MTTTEEYTLQVIERCNRAQVYVARDVDGNVLYVGCSHHIKERLAQHRRTAPWWPEQASIEVRDPLPWREALALERELTWALGPIYNGVPLTHRVQFKDTA